MAHPGGRPREHDREALKPVILERLASGELLIDITRELGLQVNHPFIWAEEDPEFRKSYARARIQQAHVFAEQTIKIAAGSDSWSRLATIAIELEDKALAALGRKNRKKIISALNFALINRNRLMVDSLKWFTSKIAPKIYGDKLDITSDGEPLRAPQVLQVQFVAPPGTPLPTGFPTASQALPPTT